MDMELGIPCQQNDNFPDSNFFFAARSTHFLVLKKSPIT